MSRPVPKEIEADLRKARRLAWWTIVWIGSIVIVMGLVMGSSQAMKTAWIEDILSMVPAIVLLFSLRLERKEPTALFHHGFDRSHSLAFLIAAVALTAVGAVLLIESTITLSMAEHVTIPSIHLFGHQVWLGWLMIGALAYSAVPPLLLGRMKLPLAERTHDAVLHTDAKMQKADWMTGLAGIGGILGIGLGFWWADAAAAAVIALSILSDGVTALRIATSELVDGAPRQLGSPKMAKDAHALLEELQRRYPGADVRLREAGRYVLAQVRDVPPPQEPVNLEAIWPGHPERAWRFAELSFAPPEPHARAEDHR